MLISTAALCLALNVFHEARGEFIPGQYAVALVTLNRAEHDPAKVCDVVFKRHQFSWTKDVKLTKKGWEIPAHLINPTNKEPEAWARAWRIAQWTLAGKMPDFTQGAKFYHAKRVKPVWRMAMTRVKALGEHIFYRA